MIDVLLKLAETLGLILIGIGVGILVAARYYEPQIDRYRTLASNALRELRQVKGKTWLYDGLGLDEVEE